MRTLIDLSVPTESSPSEPLPLEVKHQEHRLSVDIVPVFPAACSECLRGPRTTNLLEGLSRDYIVDCDGIGRGR